MLSPLPTRSRSRISLGKITPTEFPMVVTFRTLISLPPPAFGDRHFLDLRHYNVCYNRRSNPALWGDLQVTKSGGSEKQFYRQLIAKADERFDDHLSRLKKETMVTAVATLEQPLPLKQSSFAVAGNMPKSDQGRKVG